MYGEGKNLSAASASNISWTLLSDMRTLQNRNIYLAKKEILDKVFQTRSVDLVNTEILDNIFCEDKNIRQSLSKCYVYIL